MDSSEAIATLEREGLVVTEWTDEPGATYEPHSHARLEVRVILDGEMVIVLGDERTTLRPGDRIDIAPGQVHSATVGPSGVRYLAGTER